VRSEEWRTVVEYTTSKAAPTGAFKKSIIFFLKGGGVVDHVLKNSGEERLKKERVPGPETLPCIVAY
jgi:hypothetical protein